MKRLVYFALIWAAVFALVIVAVKVIPCWATPIVCGPMPAWWYVIVAALSLKVPTLIVFKRGGYANKESTGDSK